MNTLIKPQGTIIADITEDNRLIIEYEVYSVGESLNLWAKMKNGIIREFFSVVLVDTDKENNDKENNVIFIKDKESEEIIALKTTSPV